MSTYTLLTGATGLVGRYLIRDLPQRGHRLAVIARRSKKESVEQRMENILARWESELGRSLPRPVCLEGDVTRPQLGLDEASCRWISENCRSIIHNAASLTFHGADRGGEPWRTNLDGTRNTIDLCHSCGIGDFHYVSTAYVGGLAPHVVHEDELTDAHGFRNDYEHSKYESEQCVRSAGFDSLTVYRPAVIAGDSETGYTNTYHGLYLYLKLMSVLVWNKEPDENGVRYTPVRLDMTGDERRNIVPVDWVSAVVTHLYSTPAAHGRTFHLAPDQPITPRDIIEAGYRYFNSYGVEFCGQDANSKDWENNFNRAAHENMTIYRAYEASDPEFDCSNLKRFAPELPCPHIDEAMLHRFWEYGETDQWGKRREPTSEVSAWVATALQRAVAHKGSSNGGSSKGGSSNGQGGSFRVGLDVLGSGGGQFTLTIDGARVREVQAGLPSAEEPVLQLRSDEFARLGKRPAAASLELLKSRLAGGSTSLNGKLPGTLVRALFPHLESSAEKSPGARSANPTHVV